MSSIAQLAGLDLVSFKLALPLLGVGTLEAVIDLDRETPPPSGTVLLAFAAEGQSEPITYQVTIIEVLPDGDTARETLARFHIFAVQGRGGMRWTIGGLDYAEVAPLLVAQDILSATGDVDTAEQGDLDALLEAAPLRRHLRVDGATARAQLTRLCDLLSGFGWRIARDGVVVVAQESWPLWHPGEPAPLWTREPDAAGFGELALDAPDLAPGQTVLRPEGTAGPPHQIVEVVYELAEGGAFRAAVRLALPKPSTSSEQFKQAVGAALPPLSLLVPHTAMVASQDADGALGLRFDGPRGGPISPPCLTLAGVPYWPGLPGYSVRVPLGARCLVQFAAGREDSPLVTAWEPNGAVTSVAWQDGTAPIARVGDAGNGGSFSALGVAPGAPIQFIYTPPGGVPLPPGPAVPISVRITTGKAGLTA